jgi:hypothetical protein
VRTPHQSVDGLDPVSSTDFPIGQDVGAEATTVDKSSQCALGGEVFQVGARLGRALAEALHGADAEASPDEGVEVDAAGDDVAPCVGVGELLAIR